MWVLGWTSIVSKYAFKDAESMTGKEFNNLVSIINFCMHVLSSKIIFFYVYGDLNFLNVNF